MPHRHVCGRCAVNLAVRLDLAYAWREGHPPEAAADAETASLAQLGTLRGELRESSRAPRLGRLADSKGSCFAY